MTSFNVSITSSDGETLSFACAEGESVLAAALRSGLSIPSSCAGGHCGTCRGSARGGTYQQHGYNPAALSPQEAAEGEVLLCRTFPTSDLALTTYLTHAAMTQTVVRRMGTIMALETIGKDTMRMVVRNEPDNNDNRAAEFQPGQYVDLEPLGGACRAYSIANTANPAGELEFLIRIQPGGQFSTWLRDRAKVGQVLVVTGPMGDFVLRDTGDAPRWFVAGGTGLAPMLSMLRSMAEKGETQTARLYFGANTQEDLFALDAIEAVKAELQQLSVELCLMSPGADWQGFSGSPADAVTRDLAALGEKPVIYVCGPPGLIDATERAARGAGLPDGSVHSERFI